MKLYSALLSSDIKATVTKLSSTRHSKISGLCTLPANAACRFCVLQLNFSCAQSI